MRTQAVCEKHLNVERLLIKCINLTTALLFAHNSKHRCSEIYIKDANPKAWKFKTN